MSNVVADLASARTAATGTPGAIPFAVTVELPGQFFSAQLYIEVPWNAEDPEALARDFATTNLAELARLAPPADLKVVSVRRLA